MYVCQNCGVSSPRWAGKCPSCAEWNTLVEEVRATGAKKTHQAGKATPIPLSSVEIASNARIQTGIEELDRVLGGGITPGSITLVGGDPGIGKSTLMLQMCAGLKAYKPLYITGEESLQQIKLRSKRLEGNTDSLLVLGETNTGVIAETIKSDDVGVVIVDSIQTLHREDIESAPGSVAQVRESATMLMEVAKTTHKPIFLVGHITKDGAIAGPKVLEHIVDTVLQFEGEKVYSYRILRAIKNRYGSTNEIGVFEMAQEGLREVKNPSEVFLSQRNFGESGTAIVATLEGTRPLLVEVQALATPSSYGVPQRSATGFDYKRLQMILAVLEKRLGLRLGQHDIFVNVAGGLKIDDPAVDLGVAAAIVSSARDIPLPSDLVMIGEIGLTGEVRTIGGIELRLNEIQKLGFKVVMLPEIHSNRLPPFKNLTLLPVDRILKAISQLFS